MSGCGGDGERWTELRGLGAGGGGIVFSRRVVGESESVMSLEDKTGGTIGVTFWAIRDSEGKLLELWLEFRVQDS